MALRILKTIFFVAVVLLVGQVRVGNHPLARHLQLALMGGGEKVLQSPTLAGLAPVKAATRWLHAGPSVDKEKSESEDYSSADRESILRLLPN